MSNINWREVFFGKKVEPVKLAPPAVVTPSVRHLGWNDYERVLMALCVWRESRGEGLEAWKWVAWSIRNRLENRCWYNRSGMLSEVICLPQQYSSMTAKGDGQLSTYPIPRRNQGTYAPDPTFLEILSVCEVALDSPLSADPTSGATHFHDLSVNPSWAKADKLTGQQGRLRFYREV